MFVLVHCVLGFCNKTQLMQIIIIIIINNNNNNSLFDLLKYLPDYYSFVLTRISWYLEKRNHQAYGSWPLNLGMNCLLCPQFFAFACSLLALLYFFGVLQFKVLFLSVGQLSFPYYPLRSPRSGTLVSNVQSLLRGRGTVWEEARNPGARPLPPGTFESNMTGQRSIPMIFLKNRGLWTFQLHDGWLVLKWSNIAWPSSLNKQPDMCRVWLFWETAHPSLNPVLTLPLTWEKMLG